MGYYHRIQCICNSEGHIQQRKYHAGYYAKKRYRLTVSKTAGHQSLWDQNSIDGIDAVIISRVNVTGAAMPIMFEIREMRETDDGCC
jgi:hypothetical protein